MIEARAFAYARAVRYQHQQKLCGRLHPRTIHLRAFCNRSALCSSCGRDANVVMFDRPRLPGRLAEKHQEPSEKRQKGSVEACGSAGFQTSAISNGLRIDTILLFSN